MDDTTTMRILLAEDDAGVRNFLVRALKLSAPGAEVEAVADGRAALAAFAARPADLVISDQNMPRLTGLELFAALRASSNVPFVLISADPANERRARLAGCSCFLAKPLVIERLRAVVAELVPPDPVY